MLSRACALCGPARWFTPWRAAREAGTQATEPRACGRARGLWLCAVCVRMGFWGALFVLTHRGHGAPGQPWACLPTAPPPPSTSASSRSSDEVLRLGPHPGRRDGARALLQGLRRRGSFALKTRFPRPRLAPITVLRLRRLRLFTRKPGAPHAVRVGGTPGSRAGWGRGARGGEEKTPRAARSGRASGPRGRRTGPSRPRGCRQNRRRVRAAAQRRVAPAQADASPAVGLTGPCTGRRSRPWQTRWPRPVAVTSLGWPSTLSFGAAPFQARRGVAAAPRFRNKGTQTEGSGVTLTPGEPPGGPGSEDPPGRRAPPTPRGVSL